MKLTKEEQAILDSVEAEEWHSETAHHRSTSKHMPRPHHAVAVSTSPAELRSNEGHYG